MEGIDNLALLVDDIREQVSENKVDRCLEADLFYMLADWFGFPVQNIGTKTANIGKHNARIFAWAENNGVEIEIIVKRKGR